MAKSLRDEVDTRTIRRSHTGSAIFSIITLEMTAESVEPQTVHFTAPLCVAVTPHSRHLDIEPALAHSRACTPRRLDGQIRDVNTDNRPDLPLYDVVAATGIDSGSTSVEHDSGLTAVVPPLRRQSR